jgi:hypothetical protein
MSAEDASISVRGINTTSTNIGEIKSNQEDYPMCSKLAWSEFVESEDRRINQLTCVARVSFRYYSYNIRLESRTGATSFNCNKIMDLQLW